MSYSDKINQCAKILGVNPSKINELFVDEESFSLLIENLSESDVVELLHSLVIPNLTHAYTIKAKAAAKVLIGVDGKQSTQTQHTMSTVDIPSIVNAIKPIANWSDREILNAYITDSSDELESQLVVRSKGRRFVITNPTESDNIDVESTLSMLKRARKEEIPEYYRTGDGSVVIVYRITELNRKARTRHLCPVCGSMLFDDHCSKCDIHFGGIDPIARQFVSFAKWSYHKIDKLIDAARLGMCELTKLAPMEMIKFSDARDEGKLPVLIKIEKPAQVFSRGSRVSDPFKVA